MNLKETVGEILRTRQDLWGQTPSEVTAEIVKLTGKNYESVRRILYKLGYHLRLQLQESSQKVPPKGRYEYDPHKEQYFFFFSEGSLLVSSEELTTWIRWYTDAGMGLSHKEVIKKIWIKFRRKFGVKTLRKIFVLLDINKSSPPLTPESLKEMTVEEAVQEWRSFTEAEVETRFLEGEPQHWRRLYEQEKRKEIDIRKLLSEVTESFQPLTSIEIHQKIKKSSPKIEPCIPVLLLCDWHVGMKDLDYNSKVLEKRLNTLVEELFEWMNTYHRPFEEFHIAVGGDILDGAVELRSGHYFQQDLHGAEQIAYAASLLATTINNISRNLEVPINVHTVTGNHGRATKNYREDPGRLCESICYFFAEKITPEIKWHIHSEIVAKWKIFSTTCFLTHGDLTPKDLNSLVLSHNCGPPSLILVGHKHELSCSQKNDVFVVSGGSLCGTTSFSRDRLGLLSTPSQVLVEIRPSGPRPVLYLPVGD